MQYSNACARIFIVCEFSKASPPRGSRKNKFHPRGIPVAPISTPAVFPQRLSPFPRNSHGIRGIPAIPVPAQTSILTRSQFFHRTSRYVPSLVVAARLRFSASSAAVVRVPCRETRRRGNISPNNNWETTNCITPLLFVTGCVVMWPVLDYRGHSDQTSPLHKGYRAHASLSSALPIRGRPPGLIQLKQQLGDDKPFRVAPPPP